MRTMLLIFFIIGIKAVISGPLPKEYLIKQYLDNPSVQKFQEYLRIDTSQEENIESAVEFWRCQAAELGLPFTVYRPGGKPICVITWQGTDPALPSIMLNTHMDVVAVDEEDWTYPPFSGHVDENGNLYGRGTQDTKDVAIQYIEAIGRLIKDNVSLKRTLHITLMPDEESGGHQGMVVFRNTEEFKALNVGFALDEGLPSNDDTLYATYQDKRPWQMMFTVHGTSGHGYITTEDTAMVKLNRLINVISKHREEQINVKNTRDATDYGAYDTVNINMINGGLAPNIVPKTMSLVVDMRLAASANVFEIQDMVNSWILEAGNGTELEYIRRIVASRSTSVDNSNPFWMAMQDAATDLDIKIKPVICPAASDMLYLRNQGLPAIGFAPKSHTINRVHGSDEYLNIATFLNGIEIYVTILKKLGNV